MAEYEHINFNELEDKAISKPLITHMFSADPSAHVFDGKIYIYPSHDIDAGIPFNDNGDHFGMRDYHVYSMDSPHQPQAVDHGKALDIDNIPWAERQLWAPDIAKKGDTYYFYFPARAYDGRFKIGVASGVAPSGPFMAEPEPIQGSYSIDPAVLDDGNDTFYMYWGGLWGGQLQKYRNHRFHESHDLRPDDEPAFGPLAARMSDDMKQFAEIPKEILILDEAGNPLLAGDHERRYFEGPWVHKYRGRYYLSYSTGDTHYLCYAIGDNPYGPFTYGGRILEPVVGWTTHHSIIEFKGKWYLFYHDSSLSKGVTHLRSVKVTELKYLPDGSIQTIDPYPGLKV